MNYIIIDQGTSSTKAFLINKNGDVLYNKKIKCIIKRPYPFHVECDPLTIAKDIKTLFNAMMIFSKNDKIISTGIAFQRSTFLFWDKKTCVPVTPALSWQDSRAHEIKKEFINFEKKLWSITGTPLSPHFGGPKFLFMIRNNKDLRHRIQNDEVYFGPLSAFITHVITGDAVIDESIASRTLLYDIERGEWSSFALSIFNVPIKCLPSIVPTKHNFGNLYDTKIPLSLIIGDQQAALIGQVGLKNHAIGINYGTSGSIQYNAGTIPQNIPGLISSVLLSSQKKKYFMVEGTINACNALFYYLERILSIPHDKMLWNSRVKKIRTRGIYIPGFNGLSAPYWKTGFEDILIDLNNNQDEIIRAGMESIGLLTNDILERLKLTGIVLPKRLTASGGGAKSSLLQFISDLTAIEISHFSIKDRTAIGVYKILSNKKSTGSNSNELNKKFIPMGTKYADSKKKKWRKSLINKNIR